ncbi:putative photosynthetic complex assembly protein PuhC [Jannaschia sp. S6380]|uniref:photosynthetic complex assembly protein PuhC n=1 Tax=Jannaschia sp. S6380 TaxID=2926408 RepID=UPI001FF34BD5|nr:photosynthetic complex assembly protein PuhC [Jannaschia sp. S6380]MCK0167654.1 putative photosynthetic complex assembly protein PuhC [Jannaschia sp. S6380]
MGQLQSQMSARDTEMVPRVLVQAMFALMTGALLLVGFAVLTDRPHVGVPRLAPVEAESRVYLEGSRQGNVTVRDGAGTVIARSEADRNGFIGVIWRVLARERMKRGIADGAPVRVLRRTNGTIAILDTATDWSVELVGYGEDNVAAFARLVD